MFYINLIVCLNLKFRIISVKTCCVVFSVECSDFLDNYRVFIKSPLLIFEPANYLETSNFGNHISYVKIQGLFQGGLVHSTFKS